MEFWIGVAFLVACGLGVPVVRNLAHASMVKNLGWEGATPMPLGWGLRGLRLKRARWEGEVAFEPGSFGGGGHRGHLMLVASLGRKTPDLACVDPGAKVDGIVPTGDAAFDAKVRIKGDAELVKKLFVPEQRERLLRLQDAGGRLIAVSGGVVELSGPLYKSGADLRGFLDQCDALLNGMVASVAG